MQDVIIIGGGAGGIAAAVRAAQLGAAVTIIEEAELGGVCLNRGCVPTKALLAGAALLARVRRAGEYGITVGEPSFSLRAAMARKDAMVAELRAGTESLLTSYGVKLVRGTAGLVGPRQVEIDGEIIEGRAVIVATGSTPTKPATEGFDSKGVITTDEALALEEAPARLLILGGGPIGVEFAAMFHGFGTRVTLLEPGPQILPGEDHEVGQRVRQSLRDRGIDVLIKTAPISIRQQEEELVVSLAGRGGEVSADKVLTTGRAPCLVDLGLTEVGVRLVGGAIVVDDGMRTDVLGLFAIGDATGGRMLSHLASVQGLVAAENATGRARRMDYRAVPRCLYTDPEVGCVGLTEAQAEEQGYQFKTSTIPFTLSARATTLGELEGAVKIVAEARYGKILGVHIVGPLATELIGEAALAIQLEATAEDLAYAIRAHPTLAESQVEAARDILGQAIYLPKW